MKTLNVNVLTIQESNTELLSKASYIKLLQNQARFIHNEILGETSLMSRSNLHRTFSLFNLVCSCSVAYTESPIEPVHRLSTFMRSTWRHQNHLRSISSTTNIIPHFNTKLMTRPQHSSSERRTLTEAERKERKKELNTRRKRKNRQEWKEKDQEMQDLYSSNEARIQHLEKMADTLSAELSDNNSSRLSANDSSRKPSKKPKFELYGQPFWAMLLWNMSHFHHPGHDTHEQNSCLLLLTWSEHSLRFIKAYWNKPFFYRYEKENQTLKTESVPNLQFFNWAQ